ncbi:MAG: hypothetical protein R3C55_09175 [Parvularculaceae bacterium]
MACALAACGVDCDEAEPFLLLAKIPEAVAFADPVRRGGRVPDEIPDVFRKKLLGALIVCVRQLRL